MVSGPVTSWKIDGKQCKQCQTLFGGVGSKITADGDCSHEIKRRLLLGRKVMINLDSILKSRDITLPTKACLVKAMVFPVVMYGCESWTIKKAKKIKPVTVSIVSPSICHEVMGPEAMIFISEYWVLSRFFLSPLSPSSSGSLVPLHFLPLGCCPLPIWGYHYFSWQSWFQLELHPAGHFALCTLHISHIRSVLGLSPKPVRSTLTLVRVRHECWCSDVGGHPADVAGFAGV